MNEISVIDIAKILLKRIWFIIIVAVVCAALAFGYTKFLVSPQYKATATMYVVSRSTGNTDVGDISNAQKLISSYTTVLQTSDKVMERIIEDTQLNYSVGQLKSMIQVVSRNSTELLEVNVTAYDQEDAVIIANAMFDAAKDVLTDVVKVGSVEKLDSAQYAVQVSPNIRNNTLLGLMIGLVLSCLIVLIMSLLDQTIKSEDDFSEEYDVPVLGSVPDFHETHKKGYYDYAK